MRPELRRFLDELHAKSHGQLSRRNSFGYGIGTAEAYIKQVGECAGEGTCAARFAESLKGLSDWASLVKEAQHQPVYCGERDGVEKHSIITNSSDFATAFKEIGDYEVPTRTIMVFKNIVTSIRQDRQGDILEPAGALVDKNMPLLWQHINSAPIGKMLGIIDQNKKLLRVATAVADNALGNDAALLIEFGGLRISHGFLPLEWEFMDETEDTDYPWRGFRISRYEMMEESVVSVPANVDAIIEAYSRDKLADPIAKTWAKSFYDQRQSPRKSNTVLAKINADQSVEIHSAGVVAKKGKQGLSIKTLNKKQNNPAKPVAASEKSGCGCGLYGAASAPADEPKKEATIQELKMSLLGWADSADPSEVREFGEILTNIADERTRQVSEQSLLASLV